VPDEDEKEEAAEIVEAQKWEWISFWSLVIKAISGWFTFCGLVIESFAEQLDGHRGYTDGRKAMQERAAMEIEALTKDLAEVKK
jgi:hypothetical protein